MDLITISPEGTQGIGLGSGNLFTIMDLPGFHGVKPEGRKEVAEGRKGKRGDRTVLGLKVTCPQSVP
jgi:hypothetical protein